MQNKKNNCNIVILGAGPCGIETALSIFQNFQEAKITIIESGPTAASNIKMLWSHVKLFSPWNFNVSKAGWDFINSQDSPSSQLCPTGEQFADQYLIPLAQKLKDVGVEFKFNTQVQSIARNGPISKKTMGSVQRKSFPFKIYCTNDTEFYLNDVDIVIDATGLSKNLSYSGPGGLPAIGELKLISQKSDLITRTIPSIDEKFNGKRVAVLGCGYSAATSVQILLKSGANIIWITRKADKENLYNVKEGDILVERENLCISSNNIIKQQKQCKHLAGFQIIKIKEEGTNLLRLTLENIYNSEIITEYVDYLISNTGLRPDLSLYQELQVHTCYASEGLMKLAASLMGAGGDCMSQPTLGIESLLSPEPNFYILGSKSYGRNSAYLLRVGIEQAKAVADKIKTDFCNLNDI